MISNTSCFSRALLAAEPISRDDLETDGIQFPLRERVRLRVVSQQCIFADECDGRCRTGSWIPVFDRLDVPPGPAVVRGDGRSQRVPWTVAVLEIWMLRIEDVVPDKEQVTRARNPFEQWCRSRRR